MRNGFETRIPINGKMVRIKVNDWKIIFIDEDGNREQRLDVLDDLVNGTIHGEVGTMATLIGNLDTATVADSGGVVNDTTLGMPMVKDYKLGDVHPLVNGTLTVESMSADDSQMVQTVKGVMYNNHDALATYRRFTINSGSTYTEWLKVD